MVHVRTMHQNKRELEFLTDMIYEAIYIPENKPSKQELLNSPHIKIYYDGWGRTGDRALIAFNDDNDPVGAAWYRLFSENQKGYGYIDDKTPELGIALCNEARGMGIGTILMERLFESGFRDGYNSLSLSLSVDPNNRQALNLYKKLGFKKYDSSGTSWTMTISINN
ncbi:GNAT family N-acetyltransferase [Aquibacillus rhizosphaerae]|uniref:GNAT family N-acetyltransferase n=1 Tax=Aquibacillus rhizosphaerae TaxID=3051431 RepID=A0ABT7LCR6_9BACI|nr:GNAT family N-acetyltransferase [Aquibacillus sp. LR5S19]MDL4842346.1 GNAT family N-acetyltransferase [Aquibacillus sp. LR5S19]